MKFLVELCHGLLPKERVGMMEKEEKKQLTRRDFLIVFGGAVGLSIAGWVAVPKLIKAVNPLVKATQTPGLLDCLDIRDTSEGSELIDMTDPLNPTLVCQVNQVGGTILHSMNGRNSLEEIIKSTARILPEVPGKEEEFASKVALFITKMAEAGFINEPFYINLTKQEFVS